MRNIILITIDTMRQDSWGCYNKAERTKTPFLDSIQKNCWRFNKAYSGGPYTQAAFPGILSSSHYLDYGKTRGKCPPQRVLISEIMQKAGYATAAFHSNAYLSAFFGWNRGWDVFYDSMDAKVNERLPYIRAGEINKKAQEWLLKHKSQEGKPFFLWIHYMDPHEPYMPDSKYLRQIDPELEISEDEMFRIFKEVVLKRNVSDVSQVALAKKLYDAHIIETDEALKEFFGFLNKQEIIGDSTIFITADHGEEFAEHGGLSHDGKMFDELVKVPMCIYSPQYSEQVVDTPVSTLDIPPTITWVAGIEAPNVWQGQKLLPRESYDSGRGVYGEAIDKHGPREIGDEKEVHYYLEGDYKIIYQEKEDEWQLYNLAEDPEENNSLFDNTTTTEYMMKKIIPRVGRYQK